MATREVELIAATVLSPTVRALSFRCSDGQALGHVAGQWLNFDVVTAAGTVRRAYSIASAPSALSADQFEIAVTRVDDGEGASPALHALPIGSRLMVDGPHGFFTREDRRAQSALFIGTGTGLCPLRAMLQDELGDAQGPALTLLFGCRSERDVLFHEELQAWQRQHPRFALHVTLSRPSAEWSGLRGYVQTHLASLVSATEPPHVYVCGLTKMVAEVRRVLKEQHGYDRRMIHSERYD